MLQLDQLKVSLETEAGLVRAIDGIALTLKRGETFALVGESGCGKSMTALALMRLLPQGGRIAAGQLRLDSVDVFGLPEAQMRAVRGGRIGLIFQEPATSLNPVMRVGDQIVEAIETHTALRGAAARERAHRMAGSGRHSRSGAAGGRLPLSNERRPKAAGDDRDDAGRRARLFDCR